MESKQDDVLGDEPDVVPTSDGEIDDSDLATSPLQDGEDDSDVGTPTRTRTDSSSDAAVGRSTVAAPRSASSPEPQAAIFKAIAVAEFDIKIGNTLSRTYPTFESIGMYTKEAVANLCLPDGGHLFSDDHCYMVLRQDGHPTYYGIAHFGNRRDATQARGALQRSMLVLMTVPLFECVQPLLSVALKAYMDTHDEAVLVQTFDALTQCTYSDAPLSMPFLGQEDVVLPTASLRDLAWGVSFRWEGASLANLVRLFGVDVMALWYSLLKAQRILFTGHGIRARIVGQCCLAAPLLIAPLSGYEEFVHPYVALTDLSPMASTYYIIGTTNQLFATRAEWYDAMGDARTGQVKHSLPCDISAEDRKFIRSVVMTLESNTLADAETWVRNEFRSYTLSCIRKASVGSDTNGKGFSRAQRKILEGFEETPLFRKYHAQKLNMRRRRPGSTGSTEGGSFAGGVSPSSLPSMSMSTRSFRSPMSPMSPTAPIGEPTSPVAPITLGADGDDVLETPKHRRTRSQDAALAMCGAIVQELLALDAAAPFKAPLALPDGTTSTDLPSILQQLQSGTFPSVHQFADTVRQLVDAGRLVGVSGSDVDAFSDRFERLFRRMLMDEDADEDDMKRPESAHVPPQTPVIVSERSLDARTLQELMIRETEGFKLALGGGLDVKKHGRRGQPHTRQIKLIGDHGDRLQISTSVVKKPSSFRRFASKLKGLASPTDDHGPSSFHLSEFRGVARGCTTATFSRTSANPAPCFSLLLKPEAASIHERESLDFQAHSARAADYLTQGFVLLGIPPVNFVHNVLTLYTVDGTTVPIT